MSDKETIANRFTTPRLRELEAAYERHKGDTPVVRVAEQSVIQGYKLALEDVAPVLAEAEAEINKCRYCTSQKNGTGACFSHAALQAALQTALHRAMEAE